MHLSENGLILTKPTARNSKIPTVEGSIETIQRLLIDVSAATGEQAVPEDGPVELVIFAPSEVVEKMLPRIDRLVEENQAINGTFSEDLKTLLRELTPAGKAATSEDKLA